MAETADMEYISEKQLARRLKIRVTEVRHHLKVLATFGLVQEARDYEPRKPSTNADTNS